MVKANWLSVALILIPVFCSCENKQPQEKAGVVNISKDAAPETWSPEGGELPDMQGMAPEVEQTVQEVAEEEAESETKQNVSEEEKPFQAEKKGDYIPSQEEEEN